MRDEEIAESLTTGTVESLQEDLDYADWMIRRNHPLFHGPRFEERKQEWREYRELILAEMARRAA
ncbi:hypothetical protein [Amycolatopsis vancoresmycina]|uniref:Uncharacterized protein n=1 Tax=Amycolatopsis vancoresmycina DSM 44592 TaxID=1292037 RepID=R1G614_9PSEU|nr:hypothetical protein [Amycolatopsis vancoresmycina]EOD66888.1 hypothetical protein H480_19233 [Amycolatopsis vancoresmycina DSM 44592]